MLEEREELEKKLAAVAEGYFRKKVSELYFRDLATAGSLFNSELQPDEAIFCTEPEEQFGEISSNIAQMLISMRDNPKLFYAIVNLIDQQRGVDNDEVKVLADEMVHLLLSKFPSTSHNAAHCVSLLRPLLSVG